MAAYRFDEVARAERYFVASLLTHWLMANDFAGLRKLFAHLYTVDACLSLPEDFEVVSELDPLRDASVYHPEVRKLYREFRRIAVPDLFLRWGTRCLVVEAKFFTDPSAEGLGAQVALQRQAIARIQPFTRYRDCRIDFATLTVAPATAPASRDPLALSWQDLLAMMDRDPEPSPDLAYGRDVIRKAVARAAKELAAGTGITFEKLAFRDLLANLPRLIEQGKIYIGYTGGMAALANASEGELVNRSHYKVSEIRWSDNWISLDIFLQRVFAVRGYFDHGDACGD